MSWLRNLRGGRQRNSNQMLDEIRERFRHFQMILDKNSQALRIMSDLEEKSQGEYLFDVNYIRKSLDEIHAALNTIAEELVSLGGHKYAKIREVYSGIIFEIDEALSGGQIISPGEYVIPFEKIGRENAGAVGSKNAQLGEMKAKLNLPVPDGFAIGAWAYKHFVDANNLQSRITEKISSLDLTSYHDLNRTGDEIGELIVSCPVPDDLAEALRNECSGLVKRTGYNAFSLRSSAIGEDTQLTFAGQYKSFLNVREDEIVEKYREVLASKFTPQAIYYFLSHELKESDLAMGVGCVAMVDAAASGVIYTRDPIRPQDDSIMINSILGLGKYLVEGRISPDQFRVSRNDLSITETQIAEKKIRLVTRADGGTMEEPVPESMRRQQSISEIQLRLLAEYAIKVEAHYGTPQDIEWALDKNGQLYLLQARPLRVISSKDSITFDTGRWDPLLSGGTTICPGAGGGSIFHVTSTRDCASVPEGAVIVAPNLFPGLATIMRGINALVTETGGVASHMATLAREYRVPSLAETKGLEGLIDGSSVTVDATGRAIYTGIIEEIIEARRPDYEFFGDTAILDMLRRILVYISPLHLVGWGESDFTLKNCQTLHDITRFAHQKAIEEMFRVSYRVDDRDQVGRRLRSKIPLKIILIHLDQDSPGKRGQRWIEEGELSSEPMEAFWSGVLKEGWPAVPPPANFKALMGVFATTLSKSEKQEFSEDSCAIVSRNYMVLSLRMGYHFATIEAMSTDEISKNYIRMQFKEGGAALDRRVRRIRLLTEILTSIGFEHHAQGDFLDSAISYHRKETINEKLCLLGRITILTKQLDMALSSDAVAQWYTDDIMKRLGIGTKGMNRI